MQPRFSFASRSRLKARASRRGQRPRCWRRNGSTSGRICPPTTVSPRCGVRFRSHASFIWPTGDSIPPSACTKEDIPALAAGYGPAEIDKAILDALLRAACVDFFSGMTENIAGIDARLTRDLADGDIPRFLSRRERLPRVAVRHTVGMDDAVEGE